MISAGGGEIDSIIHGGDEIEEVFIGTNRYWPDYNLVLILKEGSAVPNLWEQSGAFTEAWPQEYDSVSRKLKATIPDQDDAMFLLFNGMSVSDVIDFPILKNCTYMMSMFDECEIGNEGLNKIISCFPDNASLISTFNGIKIDHLILNSWPTPSTESAAAAIQPYYTNPEKKIKAITFKSGCSFHKGLYVNNMFSGHKLQLIDLSECDLSKLENCRGFFKGIGLLHDDDTINDIPRSNSFNDTDRFILLKLPNTTDMKIKPVDGTDMFVDCNGLDIGQYENLIDFSRLTYADNMFKNCNLNGSINLNTLNPDNLQSFDHMFAFCLMKLKGSSKIKSWLKENGEKIFGTKNWADYTLAKFEILD